MIACTKAADTDALALQLGDCASPFLTEQHKPASVHSRQDRDLAPAIQCRGPLRREVCVKISPTLCYCVIYLSRRRDLGIPDFCKALRSQKFFRDIFRRAANCWLV